MSSQADKKILNLVNQEYMKKIPFYVRKHATGNTCRLIEREHTELYAQFEQDAVPEETREKMRSIINTIFEERMKKHDML